MTPAAHWGQVATVWAIAAMLGTALYSLWRGWREEHPKGPRGGETWQWDEPEKQKPAAHANGSAGR